MSGSLRPINLGIPDITVVVRENSDANKVLVDVPNISVNIEKLPDYKVSVQPSSLIVQRTGSLPLLAVSAVSASYALKAETLITSGTVEYSNLSASNDAYIGNNLTVVNSATIPSITGSITNAISSSYALTSSYALNAGAGTGFPFSGSAVITGSLLFVDSGNVGGITGSLLGTASVADAIDIVFAGAYQTGSDAPIALQVGGVGNVVSASHTIAIQGGTQNYLPLWASANTLTKSMLYQTGSSILFNGTSFFDETAPDVFGVYAGYVNSFNLISAHAVVDNYLQINIRNFSTGTTASSDIVATSDTGTEETGYINMGINGTSYVGPNIHDVPNDGYLVTIGNNLIIGTLTPSASSHVTLFAGGEDYTSGKLRLFGNNQHQLTGSLNISGSQNILGNTTITGSLTVSGAVIATASYATTASYFEGTLQGVQEEIILSSSVGANTSSFDFSNASIFYLNGMTGNGVWNITNVPTTAQRATTFTFVIEQGVTAYSASGYQLNSSNVNVKWVGSTIPTGSANKTDVIGLTAFRSGSTWNVLGVLSSFG